ncbi:MAG: hypothetical protein MI974_04290 [Chitinophagales bacterium]|nr:hypothetical protein [Chitinophagales bacterium]
MNPITIVNRFNEWTAKIAQKWGISLMRYALAIIYIWFGILKPMGLSPASSLVEHTVYWFSPDWFIPTLGIFEVLIGVLLLFRSTTRYAVLLIFIHLPGTFLPFLDYAESTYTDVAFELTLEGQYIVKNLLIAATAIMIGGSMNTQKAEE